MPLGDSITDGYQSTDGNGYRKHLYDSLAADGHVTNFVGSRRAGNMADPENEGWSGYRINEVSAKATASVPSRKPNVYTVDIDTNDVNQSYQVDGMKGRVDAAIENLWKMTPKATIVLSTLTQHGKSNFDQTVQKVNAQYRELVKEKQAQNKRIVLAEMHDSANAPKHPADFADDLHPNDQGYAKMANIWLGAIRAADAQGLIQDP